MFQKLASSGFVAFDAKLTPDRRQRFRTLNKSVDDVPSVAVVVAFVVDVIVVVVVPSVCVVTVVVVILVVAVNY